MEMMKYLIAVAVVAVAVAGCVRPPAATPQATVTITEEVAPAPVPERATNDDDLYLALLASEGIRASRETSIEVGKQICTALDSGYEKSLLALVAVDSGFTEREAAALVAAAVVVYCPWHES